VNTNSYTLEEFTKKIAPLVPDLDKPNLELIAKEVFLHSDQAFIRTRPPIIAVTGVTHTGKSTLINTMFGEKRLEEGLTGDTSDRIVKMRFKSGLLIYDTPGAGGLKVIYENRTRAFLGLEQLREDIYGNPIDPLEKIETIDAATYNPVTNVGEQKLRYEDFERPDLFLFVVDVTAGTLKREDLIFFRDVASLGPPIIIIANKIDAASEEKTQKALDFIFRTISHSAIPVSAKNNTNIEKVIMQIIKSLPKDKAEIITETINEDYYRVTLQQSVHANSLVTALNIVNLISGEKVDSRELVSSVLGLYLWILKEYEVPVHKLQETGAHFDGIAKQVEAKLKKDKDLVGQSGLLVLAGTVVGGIAAVSTGGLALPIGAAVGVMSGFSISSVIGVLRGIYHHVQHQDMSSEAEMLEKVVKSSTPTEAAASVYAFGRAVGICCDKMKMSPRTRPNFYNVYEKEFIRAKQVFRHNREKLSRIDGDKRDAILDELYELLVNGSANSL
jgi:ribosome biogenesis GTPase A